jgi:hypothetical protein
VKHICQNYAGPNPISSITSMTRRFCIQSRDIMRMSSSVVAVPVISLRISRLLASSRSAFCVPTLDIDQAFHAHQLMA